MSRLQCLGIKLLPSAHPEEGLSSPLWLSKARLEGRDGPTSGVLLNPPSRQAFDFAVLRSVFPQDERISKCSRAGTANGGARKTIALGQERPAG